MNIRPIYQSIVFNFFYLLFFFFNKDEINYNPITNRNQVREGYKPSNKKAKKSLAKSQYIEIKNNC